MINNKTRFSSIRNEAGSVILTFAISIAALFCFAVVAIDGAMLMATKNQLQCAADAAALAGASAMTANDNEVRRRAALYASYNFAVQDLMRPCIIDPDADVVITRNANENSVEVTTHRTDATDDPLRTYFLKMLDVASGMSPTRANKVDVSAKAKAELVDNCSARCLKPWAIPDRWQENSSPPNNQYDPGTDIYDPVVTGYQAPRDVGVSAVLKQGTGTNTVPGQYYPICYPPTNKGKPITGADQYREWIAGCCPFLISPGDSLLLEPGNVVGPTRQGVNDLIAQDPTAYWDGTKVVSTKASSPRIILVPFFDPNFPPNNGRNIVVVSKIGAFFITGVTNPGSQVTGIFIQVTAPGEACEDNTGNSLVLGLHLIE